MTRVPVLLLKAQSPCQATAVTTLKDGKRGVEEEKSWPGQAAGPVSLGF